jgi:hypothetical protein
MARRPTKNRVVRIAQDYSRAGDRAFVLALRADAANRAGAALRLMRYASALKHKAHAESGEAHYRKQAEIAERASDRIYAALLARSV